MNDQSAMVCLAFSAFKKTPAGIRPHQTRQPHRPYSERSLRRARARQRKISAYILRAERKIFTRTLYIRLLSKSEYHIWIFWHWCVESDHSVGQLLRKHLQNHARNA